MAGRGHYNVFFRILSELVFILQ